MTLPVEPPIAPMLARLTRELPEGDLLYEPKWDGFRCLAFRDGDVLDLRSRNDRPLARYFPEVVDAVRGIAASRAVLDGELVLVRPSGFDFPALMSRLHPAASRVERLRREQPATYIAFDLLAIDDEDLRDRPFGERRARLVGLLDRDVVHRPAALGGSVDLAGSTHLRLTPATPDVSLARAWLDRFEGAGIDGIVAKPLELRYVAGKRAMTKVKRQRTADCVLAGFRPLGELPAVSSLLLALYDQHDALRHVGVVASFSAAERIRLFEELSPLRIPLETHPWREGFLIGASPLGRLRGSAGRWTPDMEHDWVPLAPERVVEVGFDQIDLDRMRHPARFVRWRPDREAASCRLDQVLADPPELDALLAAAS
ncbi:MAG TPA: ATP-dependent DNA ligase [Candidatus Limnocylindrales bacterium]|nr:ATP-dependent DNA ligase [Candidatus Limnocylindrales bacterium]